MKGDVACIRTCSHVTVLEAASPHLMAMVVQPRWGLGEIESSLNEERREREKKHIVVVLCWKCVEEETGKEHRWMGTNGERGEHPVYGEKEEEDEESGAMVRWVNEWMMC